LTKKPSEDSYSEKEAARRRDEWLRRSLTSPPKQHKDMVAKKEASTVKSRSKAKK
jgi:hypothetical protein